MYPRTWLNERGMTYVGLLAATLMGVAYIITNTATAIAGIPFELIDPITVAALTTILAIMAGEHLKSNGSANGLSPL
jgi:hypothetical protein